MFEEKMRICSGWLAIVNFPFKAAKMRFPTACQTTGALASNKSMCQHVASLGPSAGVDSIGTHQHGTGLGHIACIPKGMDLELTGINTETFCWRQWQANASSQLSES